MEVNFLIIGSSQVGKSLLIKRFVGEEVVGVPHPTIGVDIRQIHLTYCNTKIKFNIYEVAAYGFLSKTWDDDCETFPTRSPLLRKISPDVLILAFDVTRKSSLTDIEEWAKAASTWMSKDVLICFAGCKTDLSRLRVVSCRHGLQAASNANALYTECSSYLRKNVDSVFTLPLWWKLADERSSALLEQYYRVLDLAHIHEALLSLQAETPSQADAKTQEAESGQEAIAPPPGKACVHQPSAVPAHTFAPRRIAHGLTRYLIRKQCMQARESLAERCFEARESACGVVVP